MAMARPCTYFLALCLLAASGSSFVPSSSTFARRSAFSLYSSEPITPSEVAYDSYVFGESKELAVKDEIVGDGNVAKEGSMLVVEYKGRLMVTGKEFQSEKKYYFKLGEGRVMKGWDKGLPGMKVGGKRLLRIPPELALGDRGSRVVPPGADLEFEIELKDAVEGPINEFLISNGFGANAKTYGIIALIIFSAILPQLQNAGFFQKAGII